MNHLKSARFHLVFVLPIVHHLSCTTTLLQTNTLWPKGTTLGDTSSLDKLRMVESALVSAGMKWADVDKGRGQGWAVCQ